MQAVFYLASKVSSEAASDMVFDVASDVVLTVASEAASEGASEAASDVLSKAESDVVSDVAGHIAGRIAGLNESEMAFVFASVLPSDVASSASRCPIATQASLRNHKGIPELYINCISK